MNILMYLTGNQCISPKQNGKRVENQLFVCLFGVDHELARAVNMSIDSRWWRRILKSYYRVLRSTTIG